ncbi:uncharacterized protein LOC124489965 [Dermatophagoides farinae]|uniref:uncharacterized protein LOC124489965 n=1 Tax=Dermatophagoides farinae TaxID=6954 RepID=UPI003F60F793
MAFNNGTQHKRVTIYIDTRPHNNIDQLQKCHSHPYGKVFAMPNDIDTLIADINKKFRKNLKNDTIKFVESSNDKQQQQQQQQLRLFTCTNGEIDDINLIRDDEILFACFVNNDTGDIMTAKCLCMIHDENNSNGDNNNNNNNKIIDNKQQQKQSDNYYKQLQLQSSFRNSSCSSCGNGTNNSCTKMIMKTKLNDEWIKLNIGGRIFTTTRSTIIAKEPESMLAKMFDTLSSSTFDLISNNNNQRNEINVNDCLNEKQSMDNNNDDKNCDHNLMPKIDENNGDDDLPCNNSNSTTTMTMTRLLIDNNNTCIVPSLIDEQGAYMIDRSPEYFEPLLGYLRHGNLIIDKHLNPMGVLEEAKFYGFYSLIPELEATVLQESLLQNTIERSIGLAPLTRKDVVKAIIQTSTATRLRFQGVNLSGADLSRLDLSNINFKYAILRGANLQGATLSNCCLERADMSKCNLEGASLINCHMVCCNLEGSILRGSNMDSPTLTELTNLEGANLNNVNLEGSKMHRVNLRIASLKNANAQNCNLDHSCLAGANLENCDLSGSDLNEVNLRGANLKGTRFDLIHTPLHMFYLTS